MCRTRRNKDGTVSKRKGWFRSAASKERFAKAQRASHSKKKTK